MAASGTLAQPVYSRKSPISRTGVLALFGYGIKVRMQCGHLEIEDGIGPERRKIRLARVGHGLKRLVIVGSDGFISLSALQWLADQNASFIMLKPDGTALVTAGPVRPSDAKLRRAQALAHTDQFACDTQGWWRKHCGIPIRHPQDRFTSCQLALLTAGEAKDEGTTLA